MVGHRIPQDYQEALQLLNQHQYQIIAGGTDLMVQNRSWSELPAKFKRDLLFVFHIEELKYVKKENNRLLIGATTSFEEILHHPLVPQMLKDIITEIASPGIRHQSTLAGNIGNASPAGDTLPFLYAHNAIIVLESIKGIQEVKIEDFILGPRNTILQANQMIKEIKIPLEENAKMQFVKVGGRRSDSISKVSFFGLVKMENKKIIDCRFTWGAVYKTIVRVKSIEEKYCNLSVDAFKTSMNNIKDAYKPYIQPIDDQRSSKIYRQNVALNLLENFINQL